MKSLHQPRCDSCGHKLKAKIRASDKAKATRARKRADTGRKRQLRVRKSSELYGKVMDRPGWRCELGAHASFYHVQMHHLKAGSAKRFYESIENCIRACLLCHWQWDNDGCEAFRERVLAWCGANDYPVPSIFRREPHAAVPRKSANV